MNSAASLSAPGPRRITGGITSSLLLNSPGGQYSLRALFPHRLPPRRAPLPLAAREIVSPTARGGRPCG